MNWKALAVVAAAAAGSGCGVPPLAEPTPPDAGRVIQDAGMPVPDAGPAVPAPWLEADIGAVGLPGSASSGDGAAFAIQAAGADIFGNADAFHFVYRPLNGDGELVARVQSLSNTSPYAKAGVMIRETLDPASAFAMVSLWPSNGVFLEWRASSGAAVAGAPILPRNPPAWVKLVRQGNTVWGFFSPDGSSWTPLGSQTVPLSASAYVGLAVTSHDTAQLATAQVDGVSLTDGSDFDAGIAAPPPAGIGAGTAYPPQFVSPTGGGAMPDWSTAVVAHCAGDGVTDDTACLQAAADSAHAMGLPLAIPATAAAYRISGMVTLNGSVAGTGGMPTIQSTNTSGQWTGALLRLAAGMSGWIYNLHLMGPFDGSNATGEWSAGIDVGAVDGVTIFGNLIENTMGDSVASDVAENPDGAAARNVLVANNTLRNPYRCAVGLIFTDSWAVMNNVIDKQVNYVSGIDFEPDQTPSQALNAEVGYNLFVMNNRTANPSRAADGRAASAWQNANTPNPGGNLYVHHNYGTFGTGMWMNDISYLGGNGGWTNVQLSANAEGPNVP